MKTLKTLLAALLLGSNAYAVTFVIEPESWSMSDKTTYLANPTYAYIVNSQSWGVNSSTCWSDHFTSYTVQHWIIYGISSTEFWYTWYNPNLADPHRTEASRNGVLFANTYPDYGYVSWPIRMYNEVCSFGDTYVPTSNAYYRRSATMRHRVRVTGGTPGQTYSTLILVYAQQIADTLGCESMGGPSVNPTSISVNGVGCTSAGLVLVYCPGNGSGVPLNLSVAGSHNFHYSLTLHGREQFP